MEPQELTPIMTNNRVQYLERYFRGLSPEIRKFKKQQIERNIDKNSMHWMIKEWKASLKIINDIESESNG